MWVVNNYKTAYNYSFNKLNGLLDGVFFFFFDDEDVVGLNLVKVEDCRDNSELGERNVFDFRMLE